MPRNVYSDIWVAIGHWILFKASSKLEMIGYTDVGQAGNRTDRNQRPETSFRSLKDQSSVLHPNSNHKLLSLNL